MFKKENFLALVEAYSDDDMVLDMIASNMNNLGNYVDSVYSMEYRIPILRARLDAVDFQDAVMDLDRGRRNAHEAAISSVKILNRVAGKAGLPPLYDGDVENRYQVADFCMEVVKELFDDRLGVRHTVEDMVDAARH